MSDAKYSGRIKGKKTYRRKKGNNSFGNQNAAGVLLPLAAPLGILLAAYLFSFDTGIISNPAYIKYFSNAIFFTGMVLSYCFNRNRIFFTIVVLALCQLALVDLSAGLSGTLYFHVVYAFTCLLLPINLLVFSLLKERGIFTPWGRKRFTLIFSQVILIAWVIGSGDGGFMKLIYWKIFPVNFLNSTSLPHISLLAFMATFIFFLTRQVLSKSSLEGTYIGVLFAMAAALHLKDNFSAMPVFFSAAGIMLLTAIMQDSYKKAYLDELTGLPARRALREEMLKLGRTYTIAMLDIDFFKKFNDKYGHDVGDEVLKMVASVMKVVAGGGKAFRYGGEEFTILFPGKRMDETIPHLDDLRVKISQRGFTPRGKDRPKNKPDQIKAGGNTARQLFITVSIGVAEKSEKHKTADEVIKAADSALYRAKEAGRNLVSK